MIRITDGAAFGVSLFDLVPEDRFDRQPICTDRLMLVADIRLDNRAEVIRAIGRNFESDASDADILFSAWEHWGEHCLNHIVGDYAFAIYDRIDRELYLARDPTGQRPLFYSVVPTAVRFASMPSGVLADADRKIDLRHLAGLLAGHCRGESSCFTDVRRVLPGQIVRFSDSGPKSRSYWDPSTDEFHDTSRNDLVDELRSLLDDAVQSRVRRTTEPFATHLSSGFDSSAVTATAARLTGRGSQPIAFTSAPAAGLGTVIPRGRFGDETEIAAATAKSYGLDHVVVRSADPLLEALRGHSRFYQEPVRNVFNSGWWKAIAALAHQRGANVLLTGELGNFSLSPGGLPILSEWVRKGAYRSWWAEAQAAARRPDTRWRGIMVASFGQWLPSGAMTAFDQIFETSPSWSTSFVRSEHRSRVGRSWIERQPSWSGQRLARLRSIDHGPLRKGALAENGVDERDPASDRRLIEFALRLPPEEMLHNGEHRPLARAALADRVSHQVLDAPARGYQGGDWFARLRQDAAYAVLEEVSSSAGVQQLFDVGRIRRAIDAWPDATRTSATKIAVFGRSLTNTLATATFILECERSSDRLGT